MIRVLPPPVWALIFLAACYGASLLPVFQALPSIGDKRLGIVIAAAALAVLFSALLHFLLVNTQITPTSPINNKLVVSGLYRFSRNPMYVCLTLFTLGVALWFGSPVMLLAPIATFFFIDRVFIPFEEEKMRRQFGAAFDDYVKRVRRWI